MALYRGPYGTLVGTPLALLPYMHLLYYRVHTETASVLCLNETGYLNIGYDRYSNQGTLQYPGYYGSGYRCPGLNVIKDRVQETA